MNSDGRNVNSNTGALCMYSVLHPSESSFPREYLWHIIHTKALTSPNFVIVKDPSADVSYTSCDGITFRLHSDHVKVNAADMPLPDSKSKNLNSEAAAIALEETSEVLDALFQFIQPPSKTGKTRGIMCTIFSNEKFEGSLLLELIKAAEKYGVNSALDACLVRLDQLVEREPDKNTLEIVNLADKYGYTDILDKVAEVALSLPLDEVLVDAFSNPGLLQRFIIYRNQWINIRDWVIGIMKDAWCCESNEDACPHYDMNMRVYLCQVAADLRDVIKTPAFTFSVDCLRSKHINPDPMYHCDYEWSLVVDGMEDQKESIKKLSEIVL